MSIKFHRASTSKVLPRMQKVQQSNDSLLWGPKFRKWKIYLKKKDKAWFVGNISWHDWKIHYGHEHDLNNVQDRSISAYCKRRAYMKMHIRY